MLKSTYVQENSILDTNKVIHLIRTYQRSGNIKANLDPVNTPLSYMSLSFAESYVKATERLKINHYGFTEKDLEKEFIIYTENIEVNIMF